LVRVQSRASKGIEGSTMTHDELLAKAIYDIKIQDKVLLDRLANRSNLAKHDELIDIVEELHETKELDHKSFMVIRSFLDLHEPVMFGKRFSKTRYWVCVECGWRYPCRSIQAIEKELK